MTAQKQPEPSVPLPSIALLLALLAGGARIFGTDSPPRLRPARIRLEEAPWYELACLEGVGERKAREIALLRRTLLRAKALRPLALPGVSAILRGKWQDELAPPPGAASDEPGCRTQRGRDPSGR